MYGAFWCSHCYDQKQAFGAEAMAAFPYVECYPEGLHKVGSMQGVAEHVLRVVASRCPYVRRAGPVPCAMPPSAQQPPRAQPEHAGLLLPAR